MLKWIIFMGFEWIESPYVGREIDDKLDIVSMIGFVDKSGLKPVSFTEDIQFVWNRIYEICDGVESPYYEMLIQESDSHDWMTFEIFECGFKSNHNALCDKNDGRQGLQMQLSNSSAKSDVETLPLLLDASGSQESVDRAGWVHDYSGDLGIYAGNLLKQETDSDLASEGRSHEPSSKIKSAVLYDGSIIKFDSRLCGFDIATCLEVIEHMEEKDACLFGDVALGSFAPKILIVSTPNYEYNVILQGCTTNGHEDDPDEKNQGQTCKFRNHDHKFEWTRTQFEHWASQLATRHGYSVEFSGVGGASSLQCHCEKENWVAIQVLRASWNCSCIAQSTRKSRNVREIGPVSNIDFQTILELLDYVTASRHQSPYRVFIFDECDTVSSECWSTILKFIEPPASRCQKFFFPKLKDADMIYTLQWIASKEDLEIDKDALKLIASRS